MAANLQLYSDMACTTQLSDPTALYYELILGPVTGLDGDAGDRADVAIYVKNTGDQVALGTTITKYDDPSNRLQFSDTVQAYTDNNLVLGNIAVGAVKEVLLKLVVPAGTAQEYDAPKLTLSAKSMP